MSNIFSKPAKGAATLPYIRIKTADRAVCQVNMNVVQCFGADVVEDLVFTCCIEDGQQMVTPVINYDKSVLTTVFEWLQHHPRVTPPGNTKESELVLMSCSADSLLKVIEAANYLRVVELAEAVAAVLLTKYGVQIPRCPDCKHPASA